jgi:mannose-1-phosphate guanylyltransferase
MPYDKEYYINFLKHSEYQLTEIMGDVFNSEMFIYDIEKLLLEVRRLGLDTADIAHYDFIKNELKREKKLLQNCYEQIDNFDLDIAHAKFMLTQF